MTLNTGTPNSRAIVFSAAGLAGLVVVCLTIIAETGKDASTIVKVVLALLPTTGFSALSYLRGAANAHAINDVKTIAIQNHAATASLNVTLPDTINKVAELRASIDKQLGK